MVKVSFRSDFKKVSSIVSVFERYVKIMREKAFHILSNAMDCLHFEKEIAICG